MALPTDHGPSVLAGRGRWPRHPSHPRSRRAAPTDVRRVHRWHCWLQPLFAGSKPGDPHVDRPVRRRGGLVQSNDRRAAVFGALDTACRATQANHHHSCRHAHRHPSFRPRHGYLVTTWRLQESVARTRSDSLSLPVKCHHWGDHPAHRLGSHRLPVVNLPGNLGRVPPRRPCVALPRLRRRTP